jgi:hypothetical protein
MNGCPLYKSMKAIERFRCYGHHNVCGKHLTTFEITMDPALTPKGDCIIAVASEKGASDLSPEFRKVMAIPGARLTTSLCCGGITVTVRSLGSPELTFDHPSDMVWRRSTFVCGRTVGISSDYVAATLPGELITALSGGSVMDVEMVAEVPDEE